MRRTFLWIAALLLISLLPMASAKGPLFFENVLVTDEAQDFANGALDIEAVYVSELYPFDPDQNLKEDRVILRIEPRALNEMGSCQVVTGPDSFLNLCQLRIDVRFEVAGVGQHLWAVLDPPGKKHCCPVNASNAATFADGTSIRMSLDRPTLKMFPGTEIQKLYVTSALVVAEQVQPGDRAPGDNENMPYDRKPELAGVYAPAFTMEGTYEFFTLSVDGTHRDSVGGQAVEFNVEVTPTKHVVDDTVRFLFDLPSSWSLTPSRGTTGADPRGLITGLSEGMTGTIGLSVSSRDLVEVGQTYSIVMHVHSSSQGYKMVPLTVRVTGPTIEDPGYVFQWDAASGLREGRTATLRFSVLDPQGAPRIGLPIDVVFAKDGRRVATLAAAADGGGYVVNYKFPSDGTWTVDARVTSLQPSPHGAVTVQVDGGGAAPSVGPIVLMVLLSAMAALKTRFPSRP